MCRTARPSLPLGESAELLAEKYGISRERRDEFALRSHRKAAQAQAAAHFDVEFAPVTVPQPKCGAVAFAADESVRPHDGPSRGGMVSMHHLLHHHLVGAADAPPLILGPSLGTSKAVWEPPLPSLTRRFRVLRFDLPGHGGSPTAVLRDPAPGRTTLEDLASLVLDLADHHGWDSFHYAGISLGGAIGTHLAAFHPERVASLTAVCSSAHFGAAEPWLRRAELVRDEGTAPLLVSMPDRWFAAAASASTPFGRRLLGDLAAADPAGYAACCDALAALDLRPALARISAPTLVVGGSDDAATPLEHAEELAEGIPRAGLEVIGCGHLAIEQPEALRAALTAHLSACLLRGGTRISGADQAVGP
ncbi:alpha/beta fold hydrolase [Streptomyces sp. NPDC052042]|uniref:alpha/beta fold hydrolase n=1 Tax=Streptomyces sp. NPDC052042 TaxID=3365683 RepID=UPI0037CEE2E3